MWQAWLHRTILTSQHGTRRFLTSAAFGAMAGGSWLVLKNNSSNNDLTVTHCEESATVDKTRIFTPDDVSEHNGKSHPETWVSYQGKVYNITHFIKEHPGGDLILDAAGGPIENYWAYWAYHMALDRPKDFLKKYEIGKLQDDDDDEQEEIETMTKEMYESDPDRKQSIASGQIELLARPWCSETDPKYFGTHFTPNNAFYVRNHAPVPDLDETDYEISLECESDVLGQDVEPSTLSLESLQERYPVVSIHSILQCAGNRGSEMIEVAPTAFTGTPYETIKTGMIGNASWRGIRLGPVLMDYFPGLKQLSKEQIDSYHVEFEGVDGYKVSVKLSRVLDDSYDTLLATHMNGAKLPPDHGGPVRVLLPGIAGARHVKWVHSIRIQPHECTSCFQKTYYLDPHGRAIQEMPMQSFMVSKQAIGNNLLIVGVAWGGGNGVGIDRVQVSIDNGETWSPATLVDPSQEEEESLQGSRKWSWVHFEANLELDPNRNPNAPLPTVTSRAFDGHGLQQPEKMWYPKGYLSNGWHKM